MSERIAIGVDAGGTAAVAALSRDGTFEAQHAGAPANARSIGVDAATRAIVAAVRAVAGDREPDALFVAAAGANASDVRAELASALRAAFARTPALAVEDDLRVALRAAIPSGPGVVVIAGTGSVAYAENGDAAVRVGGYGYLAGDEGSGFSIGLAALRLLARVLDERAAPDETTDAAARAFGRSRDAVLRAAYDAGEGIARIAALAKDVLALADAGNRASAKIVQNAALELGALVRAAVVRGGLADTSPTIALGGGLLRTNSLLSYLLETRAINETPGASIVRAREEPVRAALRFAEELRP